MSFYLKVEFLDAQYLGDGPYNTCYQECDYCKDYKKIYIQNKPVYYDKGAKRRNKIIVTTIANQRLSGRRIIRNYSI